MDHFMTCWKLVHSEVSTTNKSPNNFLFKTDKRFQNKGLIGCIAKIYIFRKYRKIFGQFSEFSENCIHDK